MRIWFEGIKGGGINPVSSILIQMYTDAYRNIEKNGVSSDFPIKEVIVLDKM